MFYRFAKTVCRPVLFTFRRCTTLGIENVPEQGGLVVVCNHVSYWDPLAVGCALPRRIYFMAKQELFLNPILKPIITRLGAYPVRRGEVDRGAIRHSLKLLAKGEIIGIFPEGTRSKTGKLMEAHTGATILAIKAKVPVLPVAVIGSDKPFRKITVVFGRPVDFPQFYNTRPGRTEMTDATNSIMGEISRMIHSNCQGKR